MSKTIYEGYYENGYRGEYESVGHSYNLQEVHEAVQEHIRNNIWRIDAQETVYTIFAYEVDDGLSAEEAFENIDCWTDGEVVASISV